MGDKQNSVDFSSLVMGFSSAALHYLGEQAVEGRTTLEKNLPLAKQNIDILLLLREKTAGNLTNQEQSLLETVVHDLQIRFVKVSNIKS